MQATLNTTLKLLSYGDPSVNSNPRLSSLNWTRDLSGVAIRDPKSDALTLAPEESRVIFDGVRATSVAADTAFSVTLSTLDPSRYRFTWTAGTDPTLRTDRGLTLSGETLTWTVNANNSVSLTLPISATFNFTGVVTGDVIFIPHTTTGDSANVISVLNAGYWQVLSVVSNLNLTLVRPLNQDFEAVGETQTLTDDAQLKAFSAAGVQVNDVVDITAGFSISTRKSFEIIAVTSDFFEVVSTPALAFDVDVTPDSTGIIFYTDAKSFIYVEADQEVVVRANADTGDSQRLSPLEAGDQDRPGQYMRRGPTWSLTVVNKSVMTANVFVFHAV